MFKPECPHCKERVELLYPPWQVQKGSPVRTCPFCGGRVEANFKASIYIAWFAVLVACAAAAGFVWGAQGFSAFFVSAFLVPLVPGIFLANAA